MPGVTRLKMVEKEKQTMIVEDITETAVAVVNADSTNADYQAIFYPIRFD